MFKSLIAFASAKPLAAAALGLTLLAGTGAAIALNCECSGESVDSLADVGSPAALLVGTAHAGDAPADASDKDCDKPCPYGSKSEATTTAAATPVADAPEDASDSDCSGGCKGAAYEGEYAASDVVAPKDAKVGSLTTCAASGIVFKVTAESPRVTVDGVEQYACCATCGEKMTATKEA